MECLPLSGCAAEDLGERFCVYIFVVAQEIPKHLALKLMNSCMMDDLCVVGFVWSRESQFVVIGS